jgi:hypothetical protein
MTESIRKDMYVIPSGAIAARMLGGEMMVMSVRDSTFFTLNEVATVIWRAADGRTPLREIVTQTVCGEFEVDFETAQKDAEDLVNQLAQHGILLVSDQPISGLPEAANEAQ